MDRKEVVCLYQQVGKEGKWGSVGHEGSNFSSSFPASTCQLVLGVVIFLCIKGFLNLCDLPSIPIPFFRWNTLAAVMSTLAMVRSDKDSHILFRSSLVAIVAHVANALTPTGRIPLSRFAGGTASHSTSGK